jgi:hypothetical protein
MLGMVRLSHAVLFLGISTHFFPGGIFLVFCCWCVKAEKYEALFLSGITKWKMLVKFALLND